MRATRALPLVTSLLLVTLATGCGDDPVVGEAGAPSATSTPTPSDPTTSPSSSDGTGCEGETGTASLTCLVGESVRLAAANAAPPQSEVQQGAEFSYTVQEYLTYILGDVDTMWSGWFAAQGLAEPLVGTVLIDPGTTATSACDLTGDGQAPDTIGSDFPNAYYCPRDSVTDQQGVVYLGSVILPVLTFQKMWTGEVLGKPSQFAGDFAAAIVTAHEMGHHVQDEIWTQLEVPQTFTGANKENIADCFAGVWMASAYTRGVLTDTDYQEAVAALEAIGVEAGGSHGTRDQRREALLLGYNGLAGGQPGDPVACTDTYGQ